ncbi:MAG TPA: DUF6529 family protein [Nonomuraea sp.]|nr:DUF6529 family protein [Nonomuraea sp.]
MATRSGTTPQVTATTTLVLLALVVGSAVAVLLGVYGSVHTPTGESVSTLGFSSLIDMKVWLASGAAALGVVQVVTALRLYGRLGSGRAPAWVAVVHRTSGTVAVLVSLPVAYHCLWSLGFATYDTRVLVHSVVGCAFYGAFVAKLLALKLPRMPGWALPVFGGLTFTLLVAVWLTSSLWFFTHDGPPSY